MEAQDQKKILATDNHGVHLCHKCEFPFPNPHPSARHRRAHKKVCGKIDGHRLIDSEASYHSKCSDDELVSDDDSINPTPKMAESKETEKVTDKLEEKSKRSEDDVFAEAVAEFSDDLLPSTSIDDNLFHGPEVASTEDRSAAGAEDYPSLQSISIPEDIIVDQKYLTGDLYPIESEKDNDTISGQSVDSDSNVFVEMIKPKPKIEDKIEKASEDSSGNVEQDMKIKGAIERDLDPNAFAQTEFSSEIAAKSCSYPEEKDSNVHVLDHSEALPKDFEENSGLKPKQLAFRDSIAGVEFGEDELKARNEGSEGEVNESFVSDCNTKEEQEFKVVPNNVSVVISAIEDASDEGANPIDKSDTTDSSAENCKETLQIKLEEIKIDELKAVSDKDDVSYRELPDADKKYTDLVSNSSTNVIQTSTQSDLVEHENSKQNLGLVHNDSMEDKILKEGVANSEPLQAEGNDKVIKPHVNLSLIDVSADSSSQTDSLEGNWGSVLSVFSTRSDVQAVVERDSWKIPKASSHNSDKSDVFEPPSFLTLVEPGRAVGQNLADSEIQNVQNEKPETLQSGWFPSFTPVLRDSDGRKKNEEIIAKVTNWSTGKEQQPTPLKNLLGKADVEGRAKSPKPENVAPGIKSFLARDSLARLPEEIKREKKKVKGRPYWAQFVCCASPNY